ncbi:MAG: hypothetical protein R2909_19250 [Gemmatimonadales bacterium]
MPWCCEPGETDRQLAEAKLQLLDASVRLLGAILNHIEVGHGGRTSTTPTSTART